jgi:hypothetical protein
MRCMIAFLVPRNVSSHEDVGYDREGSQVAKSLERGCARTGSGCHDMVALNLGLAA